MKKSILMGTSVLVAAAFAAPALAQGDEIIVTATKREQTLQDVPVSVAVTDAETIDRTAINDILDLQAVVPSLRVTQLQNSTQTNFIIRGFGNGANNAGIEPSVGVYIDGVYRSRSGAQLSDLPNLERVEVLRGPQSTLFGKNASAGVVSVVTAKPEFEWDGYLEGGMSNYKGRSVKSYLTGPLGDKLAVSLGGSINKRDGYTENVALGTDISNRDRWALRGQVLFEPTDWASFRLIADKDEIDEICCTVPNLVNGPTGGAVAALGGTIISDPYAYEVALTFDPYNKLENDGVSLESTFEFDDFSLTSITSSRNSKRDNDGDVDFNSADLIGSNLQALDIETFTQEFRIASHFDRGFNFIAGAYYFDEEIEQFDSVKFGDDFRNYADLLTGAPGTIAGVEASLAQAPGTFFAPGTGVEEFATQDNTAYSLFFQGDWELSDRLTATVGVANVNDEKDITLSQVNTDVFSNLDFAGADGFTSLVNQGLAANFPGVALACTGSALPFTPTNAGVVLGTASCPGLGGIPGATAFGGLQASVTGAVSALDLTDPAQNPLLGLTAFQFLPQLLGVPNYLESGSSDDSHTDYTVRLAYDWSDNINIYGSFSTGFKATSWNLSRDSRPTEATLIALQGAGATLPNNLTTGTRFAPAEKAKVYEFGMKGNWDRGSLNLALFDQEIDGFQSNTFTGAAFTLASAGTQSVKGMEFDAIYYPTDNWVLTAAGTFLDPEYDDFQASPFGDISGTKPGGIHETSLAASATWNWESGPYNGFVRGDWQYEGGVDIQDGSDDNFANLALGAVDHRERETNLFNASMGISKGNLDFTFWGRNLFNDEFLLSNFPTTAQTGSFSGYPVAPRTYGISLRANMN